MPTVGVRWNLAIRRLVAGQGDIKLSKVPALTAVGSAGWEVTAADRRDIAAPRIADEFVALDVEGHAKRYARAGVLPHQVTRFDCR